MKKKIMIVFGTRPEAIKMVPLIFELGNHPEYEPIVVVTAQHREMLDQVMDRFKIIPDYDFNIMRDGQTLTDITNRVLKDMKYLLETVKPSMVLVHGDTTTTFAAALASFYEQIPVGHVEAGLRTWNKYSPFPEELNRQLTDDLSEIYFAPTITSKNNLIMENHDEKNIYITGNTAIDMMRYTIDESYENPIIDRNRKNIIVTMHRRENLGQPMVSVFKAINELVDEFDDINVIFPIHKNPKVRQLADTHLAKNKRIKIVEPFEVFDFHNIANKAYLILSDSGGVQEEAPTLGVPVLVLRDTTERPEGLDAGTLKLVGTDTEEIYKIAKELLTDQGSYEKMSNSTNPYGDGYASKKIVEAIGDYFYKIRT